MVSEPAGARVGLDLAGLLDEHAALGQAGDQVQRDQGALGVLVGLGEIERAFDRPFDQRRVADDAAELGGLRAALARARSEALGFVLGLRAGRQALGGGGVGRDPLGQGHPHAPGLGFGDPLGVAQAVVGQARA